MQQALTKIYTQLDQGDLRIEPQITRLLNRIIRKKGRDHPETARVYTLQGNLYFELWEIEKARDTYLESLAIDLSV